MVLKTPPLDGQRYRYDTNIDRQIERQIDIDIFGACSVAGGSVVKNPPAVQELQETWIRSLAGEYPLEEGTATHSSILAWRIPWTEEPGGLQSMGSHRVGHD